jgi:membrane associated rhomboid family serine protease
LETRPSIRPRPIPALGNYVIMLAATCAFATQMIFDPGAHYLDGLVLRNLSAAGLLGHMWLHMTAVHLVGNLLTLWFFGRCVCPKLGSVTYVITYVLAGSAGGLLHVVCDGRPVIGASGAVMGVLGMYVVLCFGQLSRFGPWLILIWFVATLTACTIHGSPAAYTTHIGGFLAGMILAAGLVRCHMAAGQVDPRTGSVSREPAISLPTG